MSQEINPSFGSLKQIDAGVLNVGYAEADPTDGPAVILLHGWPETWYAWRLMMPALAGDFEGGGGGSR
jgi:pimeloyl-ACP methyl ester carboxylesterase